ncbi:Predicted metal-binding protein [Desulfocicer vacuolatum DSM 3385]|uniref:Predicted metal-binding protein n=1 Tax=Desulfocicer vacuolatum DSM 3385 TaxID=1121400 RepID=A0A1W2AKC6_9BACT|nr:CGGC domain-containing protein [Desulfocicer vacuolatum]SMC60990.1 Predicted metal-binding protein [Desulfocicer vacuolatum DSM 3385]
MTKIAIIRCEKNEDRCPLTGCFTCLVGNKQGFARYEDASVPGGVFTCRCPGDNVVGFAKILKSKGVDAIHFVTCTFAAKKEGKWDDAQGGFCEDIDAIIEKVHRETGMSCVKGSAHLPENYTPRVWEKQA